MSGPLCLCRTCSSAVPGATLSTTVGAHAPCHMGQVMCCHWDLHLPEHPCLLRSQVLRPQLEAKVGSLCCSAQSLMLCPACMQACVMRLHCNALASSAHCLLAWLLCLPRVCRCLCSWSVGPSHSRRSSGRHLLCSNQVCSEGPHRGLEARGALLWLAGWLAGVPKLRKQLVAGPDTETCYLIESVRLLSSWLLVALTLSVECGPQHLLCCVGHP